MGKSVWSVSSSTNGEMTGFRLYVEHMVNRLVKIAWPSFFRFPFDFSMSMSPWFHVSMSLCFYVSIPQCLHVFMSPCPCSCLHVSGIPQTELTDNGTNRQRNFHLFSAIGKQKQQTSLCLLQKETENGLSFSLVSK